MMFDIDFFKTVNDTFGPAVGDMTLKHFAYLIRHYFKDRNAVVGRWGGEEFVAVCYDSDLENAKGYALEIKDKIETDDFKVAGKITTSIGVTEIRKDDEFNTAFERMDKALYKAKSDGRNCVRTEE